MRKKYIGKDYCIQNPMSKVEKVAHLHEIAILLEITDGTSKLFDMLMSKYEQEKLIFDWMLENIDSLILEKVSVDIVKDNFLLLLKLHTYGDICGASLYIPYHANDQE